MLHSFAGPTAASPRRLIESPDGEFYGTTPEAAADMGTVFHMSNPGDVTTLLLQLDPGEGATRSHR